MRHKPGFHDDRGNPVSSVPAVLVRDLHKRYGQIEALRGVTFEVAPGETFGLIGPNGAGKTTTVECIVGLRTPDDGQIQVCGVDARLRPADAKRKIGAALQTTALQDQITPREAVGLFGALYAVPTDPSALLARFGLAEKADAEFCTLSGGQRQRLALALAFVNRPDVVFLDEPTAGLDPKARRELHGEIARMKHDGHTVLLATHDMDEAEALCDRVAVIDRGRIVTIGSPRELVATSRATLLVSLETDRPLDPARVAALPGATDVVVEGTSARLRTEHVTRTLADVADLVETSGASVTALHVEKASLEDVFIELTRTGSGG